jgi:hypothetical protein
MSVFVRHKFGFGMEEASDANNQEKVDKFRKGRRQHATMLGKTDDPNKLTSLPFAVEFECGANVKW